MKNRLVSENSRNDLLDIASKILFHLRLGTWKNITLLDEVDDVETVSTFCELHFSSYFYPYVEAGTISDITKYIDSSIYIGSHHATKREEAR